MKCTNCGSEIAPNQSFCSRCGTPVSAMKSQNVGGQQDFNNPPPPPPPPPVRKSGVPIWAFIITILLIVAIMLGVYFFVLRDKEDSDDDSSSKSSSSRNKNDENNTSNDVLNNTIENNTTNNTTNTISNNGGNRGSNSYSKVVVGNYTYKIPDDLVYQLGTENYIDVTDKSLTWQGRMEVYENTPYTVFATKKEDLANKLRQGGWEINKVEEKNISGVQGIVIEAKYSGKNFLCAYFRMGASNVVAVMLANSDYTTYDYNGLNILASVVSSIEKNSQTTTTTTKMKTEDMPSLKVEIEE